MLRERYDVVILGGGLAGLSLAVQLGRERPSLDVLVAEKRRHPAPEAAFKVGESTVEIAARYFAETLGLEAYLEAAQIVKPGLRFYFPAGDNRDIARRTEIGHSFCAKHVAYQLDRGRFETDLAARARDLGAHFFDGARVVQVDLGEPHTVTLERGGERQAVSARWVVDATGRSGLLKRQLGLAKDLTHPISAVWFRVDHPLDIGHWSDAPKWRARVSREGLRREATNHLMGRGYWVWLIPLASKATSVGIVADERIHPHQEMNRIERAMAWLRDHEPQCAQRIEASGGRVMDFLALRRFSYGAERVFSRERWGLVGEAGVFLDPFYSPGSDFIAFGNTLLADLIRRDFDGEDVGVRAERYDRVFLDLAESFFDIYRGAYPIFGSTQAMTAKITWDYTAYWGVAALLQFQGKLLDPDFMDSIAREMDHFQATSARMQAFFQEWAALEADPHEELYVDQYQMKYLYSLHERLDEPLSEVGLRQRIRENIRLTDALAQEMFWKATELLEAPPARRPIDPRAITLDPSRWEADGLFACEAAPDAPDLAGDLSRIWFA